MLTRKILDYASRHPVFRVSDLSRVFSVDTARLSKILYYLEKRGRIRRIMKGVYAATSDEKVIATGIYRPSYISMYTALYIHGALLQVPSEIQVVTTRHYGPKSITIDNVRITYYKITPRYYFGYTWRREDRHPYFIAMPEKAIIDAIYFGMSLDVGTINPEAINRKKLAKLAKQYPKTLQARIRKLARSLALGAI